MTTYYPFIPSTNGVPQFLPTFDGQQFIVQVKWAFQGQRYFVQCNALDGTLVYNQALIESQIGFTIDSLVWDDLSATVNGETSVNHGYKIGSTIRLKVNGAVPADYNGLYDVLITGLRTFSYPLQPATALAAATTLGMISFDINMNAGYFTSSLVFRNQTFEVDP